MYERSREGEGWGLGGGALLNTAVGLPLRFGGGCVCQGSVGVVGCFLPTRQRAPTKRARASRRSNLTGTAECSQQQVPTTARARAFAPSGKQGSQALTAGCTMCWRSTQRDPCRF